MKPNLLKKTSGLLATLLILSILVPVLAYAADFDDVKYNNDRTLTGEFLLDGTAGQSVYDAKVGNTIQVAVYHNNQEVDVVTATYSTYVEGQGWKYTFPSSTVLDTVYDDVVLRVVYGDNEWIESPTINRIIPPPPYYPPVINPPVTPPPVIINPDDNKADPQGIIDLLLKDPNARLWLDGEVVQLPAWALLNGESLTVANRLGSYTLPLEELDPEGIAKRMGVSVNELYIGVEISDVTGDLLNDVEGAVDDYGATAMAAPVNFEVKAVADGKTPRDVDFGGAYTQRTVNIAKALTGINTDRSTGVMYDPVAERIIFVPSVFAENEDASQVVIWRSGNSVYSAITMNKNFPDVADHWGKRFVDKMANKLIVEGYQNRFEPDRSITRAEFATIVVKALGLSTSNATGGRFTDVAAGSWYANAVNTAAANGLLSGYPDKTFKPDASINREEMASIIVHALTFAGYEVEVTDDDIELVMDRYTDSDEIGDWAVEKVAAAVNTGIITGVSEDMLDIQRNATRAEGATMLTHLLETLEFIDK